MSEPGNEPKLKRSTGEEMSAIPHDADNDVELGDTAVDLEETNKILSFYPGGENDDIELSDDAADNEEPLKEE